MDNRVNGHFMANPELELSESSIPVAPGPDLFVVRMKANEKREIVIYSKEFWGVEVHFGANSTRSSPHFKNEDLCPGCLNKVARRWKYYLHVYDYRGKRQIFLELTPGAAKQIWNLLPEGQSFRGVRMIVERGPRANAHLKINLLTPVPDDDRLPAAKDPKPSLMKLWGYEVDGARSSDFPPRRLPPDEFGG